MENKVEPQEKLPLLEKLSKNWVAPFFTIVTIVYGFFFKYNMDKLEQTSQGLKNLQTQVEVELRQKEFENNLKLTIYKEVKDAIGTRDTAVQGATLIVINEMLREDSSFREKLKTILFSSTNSEKLIEKQQKIDAFSSEQALIAAGDSAKTDFRVDIFYLEDIPKEAYLRAKKIAKLLENTYQVRLRLLPKEVNARKGYRIGGNQIRFEATESKVANDVLKVIKDAGIFELETPVLYQSRMSTPNYVSIFVRNM